jgi:hypothetical protein
MAEVVVGRGGVAVRSVSSGALAEPFMSCWLGSESSSGSGSTSGRECAVFAEKELASELAQLLRVRNARTVSNGRVCDVGGRMFMRSGPQHVSERAVWESRRGRLALVGAYLGQRLACPPAFFGERATSPCQTAAWACCPRPSMPAG